MGFLWRHIWCKQAKLYLIMKNSWLLWYSKYSLRFNQHIDAKTTIVPNVETSLLEQQATLLTSTLRQGTEKGSTIDDALTSDKKQLPRATGLSSYRKSHRQGTHITIRTSTLKKKTYRFGMDESIDYGDTFYGGNTAYNPSTFFFNAEKFSTQVGDFW